MKRQYMRILGLLGLCWFGAVCSRQENTGYNFSGSEGFEPVAILETTKGSITLEFYTDVAPVHVENFLNLCDTGFYNGTYFHRVAPSFLIQGGDPNTKDDDISNDGLGGHTFAGPNTGLLMESEDGTLSRGSIAMARAEDSNSAGSQFFIMLADAPSLDGQYTVFGNVIEGIEVVEELAEVPGTPVAEVGGFNPTRHQYIEECRVEERPVDTSR